MATLQANRDGITLSGPELVALLALSEEPAGHHDLDPELDAAISALTEAKLVVAGRPIPLVERILAVLGLPLIDLHLETFVISGVRPHDVIINPTGAVIQRYDEAGDAELFLVELADLVPTLFRYLGLGPRPAPAIAGPVTVPVAVLHEVASRPGPITGATGVKALEAAGLPAEEATAVTLLLLERRASWRATSQWASGPDELSTRELVLIDGGRAGLWRCRPNVDRGTAEIEPITAEQAAAALRELIPRHRAG